MDQSVCEIANWKHLKQHNAVTCGPYCVKMVLNYFGLERSIDEICEACCYCSRGTLETGLTIGLTSLGLNPMLYMVPDGETVKSEYRQMKSNKLAITLRRRGSRCQRFADKQGFLELAEVVKLQHVTFEIPTLNVIEKELALGHPWIVVVKPFSLYGFQNNTSHKVLHFIVVHGYDKDFFYILDPGKGAPGLVPKSDLLYSMYNCDGGAISIKR